MSKPERIQRKRTKGWKMPPNTVYVGRGSIYGNPFRVGEDGSAQDCVDAFRHDLQMKVTGPLTGDYFRSRLEPLRGKNLACWCKPGEPCHADVLIELANGVEKR